MRATTRLLFALLGACALAGCGRFLERDLRGTEAPVPADFSFLGETKPCYIEVPGHPRAIRVNCFHVDGTLHITSDRWTGLPRPGRENWTFTAERVRDVRVEIDGEIYPLQASRIQDETRREQILRDRGYVHAWSGIRVLWFQPREQRRVGP